MMKTAGPVGVDQGDANFYPDTVYPDGHRMLVDTIVSIPHTGCRWTRRSTDRLANVTPPEKGFTW